MSEVVPVVASAPAQPAQPASAPVEAKSEGQPAAETTKVEAAKPEKPVEKHTQRIASLSRENRELQKRLKELEPKAKTFEEVQAKAKQDPKAIIETFGLTFDQLVDAVAGVGDLPKDPLQEVQARLEAIENEKKAAEEAKTKSEQEAASKAHSQAISAAVQETQKTIASDPVRWELVGKVDDAAETAFNSVLNVITSNPEKDFSEQELNGLLAEALDQLEAHYTELGNKFSKGKSQPVAAGLPGYQFHRHHRCPGAHPVIPARSPALTGAAPWAHVGLAA